MRMGQDVRTGLGHGGHHLCLTDTIFSYIYILPESINSNMPHLKSPKNQNRRAALGRPVMKLLGEGGGGLELVYGRPTLALSSALVTQTLSCLVCVEDS